MYPSHALRGGLDVGSIRHWYQTVVLGRPAVFSHDPAEDALTEKRLITAAQLAGYREVQFCPSLLLPMLFATN